MSKKEPEHAISLRKMLEHPENAAVLNHHCDQRIKQAPLDVSEVRRVCEHTLRSHRYAELNEDGAVERAVRADSAPASLTIIFMAIFVSVAIAAIIGVFVSLSVVHHKVAELQAIQHLGGITVSPSGGDYNTTTEAIGTTTAPTFTEVGKSYPQVVYSSDKHEVSFKLSADCWIRVHAKGKGWDWPAKVYHSGDQIPNVSFFGDTTVRVRSGCPGAIQYWVDGKPVHPASQSQSDRIELVTLP